MSLLKKASKSSGNIINSVKSNLGGLSNFSKTDQNLRKELEVAKHLISSSTDLDYSANFSQDIQYNEMELFLFNHKGWLCGYLDDDFTSADHLLMRLAIREPKGILLGDCNIKDFDKFKHGIEKYSEHPEIEKISGENLLARQMFIDYFRNDFPINLDYVKEYGDYKISELDKTYKRRVFNANLTASYYGCYYEQMKIFYTSPNKLLHLEDLVINNSLEEIQYLFYLSCQEYIKRAKEHQFTPALTPPEFYINLQRIVQEIHTEKLYDKKCQYSAAVFRKIHKLYPDNVLLMPHNLVMKTYEHITDTFCPEFDEIYRNKEFKQKLRETETNTKSLAELLEKISILSHLIDKEFICYIQNGVNPLKTMFAGKFGHFDDDQTIKTFSKVNSVYQSELERIFFEDLKRISETLGTGRMWTRDYSDECNKYDKTSDVAKNLPKSEFLVDKFRNLEEMKYINNLLMAQIGINIRLKEKNGENMNIVKLHLRKYFSGIKTKQNEELFNQLLVEANTNLGLLKLPKSFRRFENLVSQIIYKKMEDILGEDPQKAYQNAMVKIYNQLRGIDPFIVKDGSEPEMKENLIIKSNNKFNINLLEITDRLIFSENNSITQNDDKITNLPIQNLTKNGYNKSISAKLNKKSYVKKIDEEIKKQIEEAKIKRDHDSNSDVIDIDTIENTQNEAEKKKLQVIRDFKLALEHCENDEDNQIMSSIDTNIFKSKSLEELKKMDIQEIGSYQVESDQDGYMSVKTLSENESEVQRIEREMTVSGKGKRNHYAHVDIFEQSAEKSFITTYKSLAPEMYKKDMQRAKRIETALENGEYLDDPIYVSILMNDSRLIKLREKLLKKFFTSDKKKSSSNLRKTKTQEKPESKNLLDKYAIMDGDIVENMIRDDVFYKYDSSEGKKVFGMYNQYMNELDLEGESEEVINSEKIGTDFSMEGDLEEQSLNNVHEFLKDRIDELKSDNKKIYPTFLSSEKIDKSNSSELNRIDSSDYAYNKGRNLGNKKSNNKKLKLL